jgi:hypothetical protein
LGRDGVVVALWSGGRRGQPGDLVPGGEGEVISCAGYPVGSASLAFLAVPALSLITAAKWQWGRSSEDDKTSGFSMHPHDRVVGVRALGTRRRLVKTVPDRLGPPRELTGYLTLAAVPLMRVSGPPRSHRSRAPSSRTAPGVAILRRAYRLRTVPSLPCLVSWLAGALRAASTSACAACSHR